MSPLPGPARLFVATTVVATAVLTTVLVSAAGRPAPGDIGLGLACVAIVAMAWLHPIPLSFKRKLTLDAGVLMASVLLFPPGPAMLIAGAGILIAQAIQREDPSQAVFNAAQTMLQVAAAELVLTVVDGGGPRPVPDGPGEVALIVLAGAALYVVGNVCVAITVALQAGMHLLPAVYRTTTTVGRDELVGHFVQVGIGAAAAVLLVVAPWALLLLLLPALITSTLIGRTMQLRWRAEAMLRHRSESLAEAQRIGRVGSWEWDLTTGHHTWSDETYRILGLAPGAVIPSHEALLQSVPPADRALVDQSLQDALYEGKAFHFDHRVRLPDGTEAAVENRGGVVVDDGGNKTRVVGTLQDITERKVLEARVQDMNDRERSASALAESRRRLVASRETETLRLARDLHDGPVQELIAISYQLAGLRRSVRHDRSIDCLDASLESLRQDMLQVVGELRGHIGELRPPGLAEFGLPTALRGYVDWLVRTDGDRLPEVALDLDDATAQLPQPLAFALFRVVQEGLRNSFRHAAARQVTVSLRQHADELVLEVEDDGRGFDVPPHLGAFAEAGHFGLVGMAERVAQAAGELTIRSVPNEGTTLRVRLPLTATGVDHGRADSGVAR